MSTKIKREGLDVDYYPNFFKTKEANQLLRELESEITYLAGDLARVNVFGKWHDIPRQQVAYGDPGLIYKYSGVSIPAKNWTPTLLQIKNQINKELNKCFNFVLINRYRDGNDYIGFHRDDEKELDKDTGIASVSLGRARDFIFRQADKKQKPVPLVKLILNHGSVLLMNYPTNKYWQHSLPRRKTSDGVRVNLTFRKIVKQK